MEPQRATCYLNTNNYYWYNNIWKKKKSAVHICCIQNISENSLMHNSTNLETTVDLAQKYKLWWL